MGWAGFLRPGRAWLHSRFGFWGWFLYLREKLWRAPGHSAFWILQAAWAPLYVAMIFITLPDNTRYYLPIYPLLLFGAIAGWQSLPACIGAKNPFAADGKTVAQRLRFAGLIAWTIPAFALLAVLPHIDDNAFEMAPPVRVLESLKQAYPAAERPRVWLYLTDSLRHGEWYAPEFHLASWPASGAGADRERDAAFAQATALYTDDETFLQRTAWSNVHLVKFQKATRRKIIHNKHSSVTLYRIERTTQP